jgi:hypothetical protein
MIPIPMFWTQYTSKSRGRVVKSVPCENCSIEYVYLLEREASGAGTTMYMLNEEGAASDAISASEEALAAVLEHDYDPIPCPACGHYQRFMFPKLLETKGLGGVVLTLAVVMSSCLAAAGALYWSITYLQRPTEYALSRMIVSWSILLVLCLVGLGLSLLRKLKIRRFDPNREDQQERIAKGKSRAITRAEFDKALQKKRESEADA